MAYNVLLMSGLTISVMESDRSLPPATLLGINRIVQGYFDKVVAAHDALPGRKKYGSALVRWLADFPNVAADELLIYVMPLGTTIASTYALKVGSPPPGHDGRTHPGTDGVASEVYTRFRDPQTLANLIFHEAMHNKLALDNDHLHPRGGLAVASVGPETKLTDRNIQEMAAALDLPRRQWTKGIKLISDYSMIPDSDPTKGIL